jgi:hypothetical protein
MIVRSLRLLLTFIAFAAVVYSFAQIAVHWAQLPSSVPSNISADGSARGAMAAWTMVIPLIIEGAVAIVFLVRPSSGRYPKTETGWAATWLALACGFTLVASAQWAQIDAALHPQMLHPLEWYNYTLIAGIVAGAVIALLDARRRPGESAG